MARLRVRIESNAAETIRRLHPGTKAKIRSALDALQREPGSGKELRDELAGLRSYRVGRMRIVYRMARDALQVIDVGRRDTIYEELARRIRLGHVDDRL